MRNAARRSARSEDYLAGALRRRRGGSRSPADRDPEGVGESRGAALIPTARVPLRGEILPRQRIVPPRRGDISVRARHRVPQRCSHFPLDEPAAIRLPSGRCGACGLQRRPPDSCPRRLRARDRFRSGGDDGAVGSSGIGRAAPQGRVQGFAEVVATADRIARPRLGPAGLGPEQPEEDGVPPPCRSRSQPIIWDRCWGSGATPSSVVHCRAS